MDSPKSSYHGIAGTGLSSSWSHVQNLYRSLLTEGPSIAELASTPLTMPVLTVAGSAGEFVPASIRHVAPHLEQVTLPDVALEAPLALAEVLRSFFARTAPR